jgi:hypothetical protein
MLLLMSSRRMARVAVAAGFVAPVYSISGALSMTRLLT